MSVPRHWVALLRLSLAHGRHRPLQSVLLVTGVALGVAVGAAIDLANGSALTAFNLSTEAVTGRATHRVVAGSRGLDERLYTRLRVEEGIRAAAPAVEGPIALPPLGGESLTLLGVDPLAESPFRDFLAPAAGAAQDDASLEALLATPGGVVVSEDMAARAGLEPGDPVPIDVGGRLVDGILVGLLAPADSLSRRALDSLVLADISTAQEVLGKEGRLDRIDLLAPDDPAEAERWRATIEAALPGSAALVSANEQQSTVASMTAAFRLNLTALSLMALVVGMFLILNTVRFSVVQRRRTLAVLRMLGVTRREVFAIILLEALALGVVGSALGLALGVALGRGAVVLVTQTVNDLFFVANVRGVEVPLATLVRGAFLGVGAAVVAALVPAYEAMNVPPVAALRRSDVERGSRRSAPRALAVGALLALAGLVALAVPGERVDLGFVGLAGVVLAFAFAAPMVTLGLMAAVRPVSGRLLGLVGRMAPRDVERSLSRTAVAIAALAVAVCVSIGVQLMVDSFRATVEDWLAQTLQADVFVSPRGVSAVGSRRPMDPRDVAQLKQVPEALAWSTAHDVTVRSPSLGAVDLVVLESDLAGPDRRYLDAIGDAGETWQAVVDGAVVVSEPLARRHALRVGDTIPMATDRGIAEFEVAGVFLDYATSQGVAYMDDRVYRSAWSDPGVTSVALTLRPGADPDTVARNLRASLPGASGLEVRSNRGLRLRVMEVFDRAFAITGALRVLAVVVAFMGVLSALLAVQLERRREYATLRATGMTERQLAGLSLLESALVGGTAGLLSWPAGLSLALVLIYVINRRSFGWTIDARLSVEPFLMALALSVAAALLAGIYPAVRLGRQPLARGLREE